MRGIRLKDGAKVVGMVCTNDVEAQVLTITQQGMAKRSRLLGLMHEEGSSARGRTDTAGPIVGRRGPDDATGGAG